MINLLYTVSLLELLLGGGGRLLEVGPGTVRMVLFVPCTLIGLAALFVRRRLSSGQKLAVDLVLFYLVVHLSGLIVGALRGKDFGDMLVELQQSMYWLAAPFYALVLQSPRMVSRSARVVEFAGVLLAVGYIGILVGGLLGYIDILSLLRFVAESGEFVGRGENLFVYKGFLYLGVAVIFLVAGRRRYWKTLTVIVGAALVLTLTRGFLLATGVAVLLMLMLEGRRTTLFFGSILVVVGAFLVLVYLPTHGAGPESRDTSNNQRIVDTQYLADNIRWETFVFGEGFAAPINGRPTIENTFMQVFWKLGMLGVLFWMTPLAVCLHYFRRIHGVDAASRRVANAFFFGVVLVYVQTLTNPYLNNPIGLSFVLVAIFSLHRIAQLTASQLGPARAGATAVPAA